MQVEATTTVSHKMDNQSLLWQRRGLLGWWLNLTAPPRPTGSVQLQKMEQVRKAELNSIILPVIFTCLVALISNNLADPATAVAVLLIAGILACAALLNRLGHTRLAVYFAPVAILFLVAALFFTVGGLELIDLPLYDLCAIPVMLVSLIGHRRSPWILALLAGGLVLFTFLVSPHRLLQIGTAQTFDGVSYETMMIGYWGMINRHLILLFNIALFGWLGARSVEKALRRADRSDELVRLQVEFARKEQAQAKLLADFLQELGQAFAAQANGQRAQLAPRQPDDPFYHHANFFNERLSRFSKLLAQRDVWQQGTVVQALQSVMFTLGKVQASSLGVNALDPALAQTGVEIVDQLVAQIHDLIMLLVLPHRRSTPPPSRAARPSPPPRSWSS
jgi:Skp family chaperone for outer membrane proteins